MELIRRRAKRSELARAHSQPSAQPPQRVDCAIEGDKFAPVAARRVFDDFVNGQLDDRRRSAARLLITELVTNSVRHAGNGTPGSIGLGLRWSDTALHVSVTDDGPGFDPASAMKPADGHRPGGRGLLMVDALADRWGVERAGATRVWFEVAR
jgi:anti-sigma regulatory factor (Ser/Thr protein kinase)